MGEALGVGPSTGESPTRGRCWEMLGEVGRSAGEMAMGETAAAEAAATG